MDIEMAFAIFHGSGPRHCLVSLISYLCQVYPNSCLILFATIARVISIMIDMFAAHLNKCVQSITASINQQQKELARFFRFKILLQDLTDCLIRSFSWIILIATCYTFISLVTTSFWIIDLVKPKLNAWRSVSMAMQQLAHTVALIIVPYTFK